MNDKISKPKHVREQEEKYFAAEEAKKRKRLREHLDQKKEVLKKENLLKDHWMKCPKCGHDLVEKSFQDVMIDQCANCQGIYLDAGELELLMEGSKSKGFFGKFMDSIVKGKD